MFRIMFFLSVLNIRGYMNILLVDDDQVDRAAIIRTLKQSSLSVN